MQNSKIKIMSGWTAAGGSTIANINLCNLFNEKGLDCTFYGSHPWHMDKCKGAFLDKATVNEDDEILLVHFLKMPARPPAAKKVVLSCHEKALYPVKSISKFWDDVHFVSEAQKKWHGEGGFIIPNVLSKLKKTNKSSKKTAGVIGSVDRNKMTHISIRKAIDEGFKNILIYGVVTDQEYFDNMVKMYEDEGVIEMKGHEADKQKMYDSVSKVFHSSKSETFNFIIPECNMTGTEYEGSASADPSPIILSDDEIFDAWMKCLEI